jgi:endonuclease/exonuclease/phosphatase family metal-dependent hydrolase
VLTIGEFRHNHSGKKLVVMNTHLDDQGVLARQKSAEIIVDRTNALLASGKYDGALLTGDFNSEDKEEAYRTIQFANNSPFFDVEPLFDQKDPRRQGHLNTFTVCLVMIPLWRPFCLCAVDRVLISCRSKGSTTFS